MCCQWRFHRDLYLYYDYLYYLLYYYYYYDRKQLLFKTCVFAFAEGMTDGSRTDDGDDEKTDIF